MGNYQDDDVLQEAYRLVEQRRADAEKQARDAAWQREQEALEAQYRQRLANIRRGDVASIQHLRRELRALGWGDERTAAERAEAQRAQQQAQAKAQESQYSLMEDYQRELGRVRRGDFNAIIELKKKFRARGLEV